MKRPRTIMTAVCAIATLAAVGIAQEAAQQNQEESGQRRLKVEVHRVAPENGVSLRASQVTGMTVRNPANENLGTINDLVVDLSEGKIRYLAVSYGGFLGLGDKLFAVPPSAFQVRHDADRNTHFLVLDISEERLKNAPGFDQDRWPNFADPKWQQQIDDYYRSGNPRTAPDAN